MKFLKRRDFLVGLGSLGILGLVKWDYVYGYVIPPSENQDNLEREDETPGSEKPLQVIECDYILENGLIVDGTGMPPVIGNIGIKGDTISAMGEFVANDTAQRIDASGLIITPGFIDLHTHTEGYLAAGGNGEMMLRQGVTSHIGGNCGTSVSSIGKYIDSLGFVPINVGLFIGYKMLRRAVIPKENILVGPNELEAMKKIIAQGMIEGAFGLSVGLSYYPQLKATTEELIELCKTVKEYKGFYSTHIRDEGDGVIPSVKEAILIGKSAKIPVEYSHVKTSGEKNWGKMAQVLKLVEQAKNEGLDIAGDVYGYTYSSLDIGINKTYESMHEDDLKMALKHPLLMIGSDSGLSRKGRATHPRAYGNHVRILSQYVRDQKILSLQEAIHKMTAMPAKRLRLKDRGLLSPGQKADIAVFNFNDLKEEATRLEPNKFATGMKYVFVNGALALDEKGLTGVRAGRPLKNKWL